VATAASMATGYAPSVHGIVNKEWFTSLGRQEAYKYGALPQVPSFSDVISQSSNGQSNILSVSADFQMAAAFAPHHFIQSETGNPRNKAFAWDFESERLFNLYNEDPLENYNKSALLGRIAEDIKSLFDAQTMNLTIDGVSFDLSIKENLHFFIEMEAITSVVEEALTHRRQTTVAPDLYNIVVSTFDAARRVNTDKQNKALLGVMDSILVKLLHKINLAYDQQVSFECVFFGDNEVDLLAADSESAMMAYHSVDHLVDSYNNFMQYYPQIFVVMKDSLTEKDCAALQAGMRKSYEVSCPSLSQHPWKRQTNNGTTNGTEVYDYTMATYFHILLWFNIIIVLCAFFAVYGIFTMDVGADSLLYRMTSVRRQ